MSCDTDMYRENDKIMINFALRNHFSYVGTENVIRTMMFVDSWSLYNIRNTNPRPG